MLVLAVLSISVLQQPQVPSTQRVAARLRDGHEVAAIVGCGKQVSVAPDGSAVAVVDHRRKLARVVDAATGDVRDAPLAGEVCSVALLPNGGCWLGLENGSVAHAPADGALRRFDVMQHPIDGIVCVAGNVAWSSSKAARGGVLDARTGDVRFRAWTPFGGYRERRMFLSRDGRHALHFDRDPSKGGRRLVRVRDANTGEVRGTADSYLCKRAPGIAFGLDRLFTAARVASSKWELRRFDLVTMQSHVVDDDLRGKHFVDLMLSPSARYLLEGDHEERGAMLYDVGGGVTAGRRQLGAKGALPVGFLGDGLVGEELACTTVEGARTGLTVWSTSSGERLAADLPFARAKRVTNVGSLRGGRAMWIASWSAGKDRSIEYGLHVDAFDD
jgi:hypothetical protein